MWSRFEGRTRYATMLRAVKRFRVSKKGMQNADVARKLEELAQLLETQSANPHRVRAYRRAADIVARLDRPVSELVAEAGALESLRGIGPVLARAIAAVVETGRLPMLDRLRHDVPASALLMTVPGIGRATARRLSAELGITTLEELETAAHDGRLANILGLPLKTVQGVMDCLASRLARVKDRACESQEPAPPVEELLDVDREYRLRARDGSLPTITPRRFNPQRLKWLPILRTRRGARTYTALFSNTARAHQLQRTGDWVVIYYELLDGPGGQQCTAVTETSGDLAGRRVIRGREDECARALFYRPAESSGRTPSDRAA